MTKKKTTLFAANMERKQAFEEFDCPFCKQINVIDTSAEYFKGYYCSYCGRHIVISCSDDGESESDIEIVFRKIETLLKNYDPTEQTFYYKYNKLREEYGLPIIEK